MGKINSLNNIKLKKISHRKKYIDIFLTGSKDIDSEIAKDCNNELDEYGFNLKEPHCKKIVENEYFILYQVMPLDGSTQIDNNKKPILIIPPYILGANIMAFRPRQKRSFTHSFVNKSFPTYIRIIKDIRTEEHIQSMKIEDDVLSIKLFLEKISLRHSKKITLAGYCHGGFFALTAILSGATNEFVDSLINISTPIDSTKGRLSGDQVNFLTDNENSVRKYYKVYSNGNVVVDGRIANWFVTMSDFQKSDLLILDKRNTKIDDKRDIDDGNTVFYVNRMLKNDRVDLPKDIMHTLYKTYHFPITKDGILPITIFGKNINIKTLSEKRIKYLICYSENDDLVAEEAVTVPQKYVDVIMSKFPKGHFTIMTKWSDPCSKFSLDKKFGPKNKYIGPVRFHMDLDVETN
ncbi:MAG: hypothetical protein GY756_08345 [bacterium]|nr:hypothetical protein [bacterium]